MSTIIASNVSDGTLSIPTTYVTNGSAKAWVNFNGTGTIAVRDSLNVTSLTDNGTGSYTINLTSSFNAADYSAYGSAQSAPIGGGAYVFGPNVVGVGGFSVAVCRNDENVTTAADRSVVTSAVHGDLA
jgi:hypothetical protein